MGRTRERFVLGATLVAVVVTVVACPLVVGAVGLAAAIASAWPYPLVAALVLIAVGFVLAYRQGQPSTRVSLVLWAGAGIPLITAAAWLYHYTAHR
ncbi:hypothetical protein [Pseudonocardia acaciae]|uniref:hypothetical protein n=1 Tax=Pseudonocardia acaciae TaxID=551276 RepID=UPI00048EBC4E|nr:hypothetical protein [Pseudonocardia acaciae]